MTHYLRSVPIVLIALLLLFVVVRVPGLAVPYHQDEYKAAITASESLAVASEGLTHPPLVAYLLRLDAVLFGGDHMRVLPLVFGFLSALLLFAIVRKRVHVRAACMALFLYAISFFSIWASLMVDVDGAILPFFFLLAVYVYDWFIERPGILRGVALVVALFLGLMTKLSFVLVIGALMLDYLWTHRASLTPRRLMLAAGALLSFGVLVLLAFFLVRYLNPSFRFDGMIEHALYYIQSEGRSWLQILVQAMKSVYYLSPLLLVPLLLLTKDLLYRLRPFLLYLGVGALFYFVLFDFSHGALDKYLMFSIVPFAILSGAALARVTESLSTHTLIYGGVIGAVLSGIALTTLFLSPVAMPLYPKTAWFSSILHGNLNVLTPLTGGSGPVGFYVSFLFIVLVFGFSLVLALLARFRPNYGVVCAVALVVLGVSYNVVFAEEFSRGALYGNAGNALTTILDEVRERDLPPLITYNDYGAYELTRMGKYAGRFYAAPQFEEAHIQRFTDHVSTGGGYFLVTGFPPLYEGFYTRFFANCATVASTSTGVIHSSLYLCTQAPE